MHPHIGYDLARIRIADLQAEAARERLAATARPTPSRADGQPFIPVRLALRRFFARLHLAGSGA
jgi:hypothetical protein